MKEHIGGVLPSTDHRPRWCDMDDLDLTLEASIWHREHQSSCSALWVTILGYQPVSLHVDCSTWGYQPFTFTCDADMYISTWHRYLRKGWEGKQPLMHGWLSNILRLHVNTQSPLSPHTSLEPVASACAFFERLGFLDTAFLASAPTSSEFPSQMLTSIDAFWPGSSAPFFFFLAGVSSIGGLSKSQRIA